MQGDMVVLPRAAACTHLPMPAKLAAMVAQRQRKVGKGSKPKTSVICLEVRMETESACTVAKPQQCVSADECARCTALAALLAVRYELHASDTATDACICIWCTTRPKCPCYLWQTSSVHNKLAQL